MARAAQLREWLSIGIIFFLCGTVVPVLIAFYLMPSFGGDPVTLKKVDYANLVGWNEDLHGETISALRKSCKVLVRRNPDETLGANVVGGYVRDWIQPCLAVAKVDEQDHREAKAFFEMWFVPFLVSSRGRETGLFTGYYEPTLEGSLTPDHEYSVPLYTKPGNLISVNLGEFNSGLAGERIAGYIVDGKLKPFATRGEIESGALEGRGLELLWVNDPIDAFFLHIQGSGRVVLRDGRSIRVGYHGQNGHSYKSIGVELVQRGFLMRKDVTMQSIRNWLEANPEHRTDIFNENKSFVFFREQMGEGPIGAQNVALTPQRSLAVDLRHMPLGVPIWIDTQVPRLNEGDTEWRRLMVTQDTGGAIRGVVRGDVFWGGEAGAADIAGRMKHSGRYYLLLPAGVRGDVRH
ncbi:MAG: MltA domain-containing protein [Pseudomonadota bacterium]|nr:MltA domain-containing protein [Pseudomonadota bacterium]